MMDPSDKGSETEDFSSKSPDQFKKTCADCGTSKTPLWRGGPAGPKSLCNACGIRSRKKKRDTLGLIKEKKPKKVLNSGGSNNSGRYGDGFKQKLLLMKKSTVDKQRINLGEVEQAAVLLMALSYESVYR